MTRSEWQVLNACAAPQRRFHRSDHRQCPDESERRPEDDDSSRPAAMAARAPAGILLHRRLPQEDKRPAPEPTTRSAADAKPGARLGVGRLPYTWQSDP